MPKTKIFDAILAKLFCVMGIHGPAWFGNEHSFRSQRELAGVNGFVRKCGCCGKAWYGEQVFTPHYRTLGNWLTEAKLRKRGEWVETAPDEKRQRFEDLELSDAQHKKMVDYRGGCSCHFMPPCSNCSDHLTFEEADALGFLDEADQ